VSVVPEEDVVHEEAEGSTKANRGRGVETWRYTTPMKQSKRAESVPARITTAGNINRDTTGMNETGINDGKSSQPHRCVLIVLYLPSPYRTESLTNARAIR